jgi:hypothetical protein
MAWFVDRHELGHQVDATFDNLSVELAELARVATGSTEDLPAGRDHDQIRGA